MEPSTQRSPEEIAGLFAEAFGTKEVLVTIDTFREILYIRIPGLNSFTEKQIEETAGPLLEDLDSDFEEIILLERS